MESLTKVRRFYITQRLRCKVNVLIRLISMFPLGEFSQTNSFTYYPLPPISKSVRFGTVYGCSCMPHFYLRHIGLGISRLNAVDSTG